jgi:hypothetical protein
MPMMTSDQINTALQFLEIVSTDTLIGGLTSNRATDEQDCAFRQELAYRMRQERMRRDVAPADEATQLRDKLQAIVDCYGVGTRDKLKLQEQLGHYIMEGKALLDDIKARETTQR